MKILVTGATGFVGSHLCELLTAKGHQVYSLARNPSKFAAFKLPGQIIVGELSSHYTNSWLNQLPSDLDAVIHTAGLTHSLDYRKFYKVNTRKSKRLMNDLGDRYPKLRFILISSMAAAGPSKKEFPIDETAQPRPVSHYGHSKFQAEVALAEIAPESWKKIIIRPPMVIGPRDPAFLEVFKMIKNGFIIYPGTDGKEKEYSFVGVQDLVEIIARTLTMPVNTTAPEIFLPGYPIIIEYQQIVQEIKSLLNIASIKEINIPIWLIYLFAKVLRLISRFYPKFDAQLTPDKVSEIRPDAWTCDSSKSQNALNFSYHYDLSAALAEAYRDYRERRWL